MNLVILFRITYDSGSKRTSFCHTHTHLGSGNAWAKRVNNEQEHDMDLESEPNNWINAINCNMFCLFCKRRKNKKVPVCVFAQISVSQLANMG